jgi:uncharacterized protein (DUF342 family)
MDVCGDELKAYSGKDVLLLAGRNVVLSEDGLKLFADIDGQIVNQNGRISVLNVYTVNGDVSTSTGNINFNGSVSIRGNVIAGFVVKASGNVEVEGLVEAAVIEAEGNIVIRRGFNGGNSGVTGKLIAGGSITSKFLQGGTVIAGGNIETNYIYNSNVTSRDSIKLMGKGLIVGGQVTAFKRIDANILGNENGTKTVIEVGSDPESLNVSQEISVELKEIQKNIASLQSAVTTLSKMKNLGKLSGERLLQYEKSQKAFKQLKERQEELKNQKIETDKILESFGKGFIGVTNVAYPVRKISAGF